MRKINFTHIVLSIVILCVAEVEVDLGYRDSEKVIIFHLLK